MPTTPMPDAELQKMIMAYIADVEAKNIMGIITSAVALIIGALCGFFGLASADRARKRNLGYAHAKSSSQPLQWEKLLGRMPSTVSENIHDPMTAHGTTFKAMMMLLALMCLISKFPAYDVVGHYPIGGSFVFAFRLFCPPVGIFLLVMVPSNKAVLTMMVGDFRRKGLNFEGFTHEQRYEYLMSEVQDNLHRAGGFIGMALTAMMEGCNLVYVLIYDYRKNPEGIRNVLEGLRIESWNDRIVSRVWFALACARLILCCVIMPTLGRYVWETGVRKDQRCRWLNPDYSYMPEYFAIQQLTCYVLLTGLSLFFVEEQVTKCLWFRWPLVVATGLIVTFIAYKLLHQVHFLCRINAYLNMEETSGKQHMEKKFNKYAKDYADSVEDGSAAIERLETLRQRAIKLSNDVSPQDAASPRPQDTRTPLLSDQAT